MGFEAVELGMTPAQVEGILGPPDDMSGKTIQMVGTGPLVDGTLAFWTAPGPGGTQIMVCYQAASVSRRECGLLRGQSLFTERKTEKSLIRGMNSFAAELEASRDVKRARLRIEPRIKALRL